MINDNEKSINEEESMNPTVQAVMAALNGSAGSDAGRIQRMIAAKQEAEKALAGKVSNATAEKLIQEGKDVDHAKLIANSLAANRSGGSATFTARDKQTPDYSTFGAMSVTKDGEPTHTYKLDKDGKPYRSGSSTSDSPRVTRITALDKDGKPYRNALSGLTDKEIDKLFKSGDFRVGPGGVPKRPTEAQLDAAREKPRAIKNESFEETGEIVIDIVEENGKIVELNNGILFIEEDIPFIDIVEKYYGADYIDDLINEAVTQTQQNKPVKPPLKAATFGATKAKVAQKAPPKAPLKAATFGATKAKVAQKAPPKAPLKAATFGATTTTNTTVKPKTKKIVKPTPAQIRAGAPTAPSSTEANIQKRARERELQPVEITSKRRETIDDLQPVEIKSKRRATIDDLQPVQITSKRRETIDDLQPVEIKSKRRETIDDLQPVEIKSKRRGDYNVGGGAGEPQKGTAAFPGDKDYDDSDASSSGRSQSSSGAAPATGGQPSGGRAAIPIRFSLDGQEMEQSAYKKKRESGEVESQDVAFNVRNKKTGQARAIRKGDPEYDAYYSSYKKMGRAVTEALLRMGAVLTEEGWMLGEELLESVYTEYAPVEMRSPYYYDNTGRLRIMTESEWTELGLAEVILERVISEAMDDVGSEDEDVDNDGDSDSSDNYLKNRRKKIAAAIKGKE